MLDGKQRIGPPPPHLLETEISGELGLYNPHTDAVLVLNHTASDVWRLSDGKNTLDEIIKLLALAYTTTPEAIRGDVVRTLEEMIGEGFLHQ